MRGALFSTPGMASGATEAELRLAELPNEQPRPGPSRSTRMTRAPRLMRCQAAQSPTIPAPTMATFNAAALDYAAESEP